MKSTKKSAESTKNFDLFISKLSENEILNIHEMICVRGGSTDGDADEGDIILIKPKL